MLEATEEKVMNFMATQDDPLRWLTVRIFPKNAYCMSTTDIRSAFF